MERHSMDARLSGQASSRTRRGYTLIEVLVAVALLTIALPGLVSLIVGGHKTHVASLRLDQATSIGQMVIDSLQLQPATLAIDSTFQRQAGAHTYSVRVALANLTNPPRDSSKLATVMVTWKQGSTDKSVTLSGVIR